MIWLTEQQRSEALGNLSGPLVPVNTDTHHDLRRLLMVIYTYSCLQPHTLTTDPVCCILVGSSPYRQFILWQDPCANRKASQLTEGAAQQERRLFFAF